ncbi:RNA-binding ribosome biosynthesis protein mak21 [Coniosporium tulheliwenetii]|uniref:RNA-binding ribosome biosynthesis protein mak21 n=1 Tax=Coniosporium tulheliwenetii TaxID=3383036 RepID=A0ACC2ZJQ6_9PEZI|nr:RNA-binding ribosome biosynthesis protein mak21 [Cladosporium sp. JES 115]
MGQKRKASDVQNGTIRPAAKGDKAAGANRDPPRPKKPVEDRKPKTELIFQPRPDWHTAELPELSIVENATIPPRHILDELHQYADTLLESENKNYTASHLSSSSSYKFMSDIMTSGTLEDKVSALTLLVQESPLHTMKSFENLLNLARKKSRNQALMSLGALKDLLGQGVVLPPERKLRAFVRQPGLISALQGKHVSWSTGDKLPGRIQKVHLVAWAYEDWLKRTYFELLQVLESWCNDEIEYSRRQSVKFVWELLKEKPEQEENLLRLLINKLGDKEKKIASQASYLILQLQNTHPAMKMVIINAIESELLFRSGQTGHAKYYAIITLNQTVLSGKEQEVANKLLEVYFALFVNLLKDTKSPVAAVNTNGQIQGGGSKPGKKANRKAKLREQADQSEEQLRERMIAAVLTGVNRAFPFSKTDDATFESQMDTIFRVTHSSNFNTSIQALLLIQQISASKQYSADRFYRTLYESLLDPRLLTSSKQLLYLELLYRSLKSDINIKRVKAFVKRLLQIITLHEPPFACGVLFLISKLQLTFPSLKAMLDTPETLDDDEEHFVDAPEDGETPPPTEPINPASNPSSHYNPRKRDPEHSNADRACLWELAPLSTHFHPSVALFADRLLRQQPMPEKPDMRSHTLVHFLDRFAYRSARVKEGKTKGSSIMQPLAGANTADREEFWRRKVEDVGVDEVFFHRYFERAGKGKVGKKEKREKREKKRDGDEDEDDEEEIWKALVESRPEVDGPEDDEEGFSDMESLDEDEDGGLDGEMDDDDDDDDDEGDAGVELVGFDDDNDAADAAVRADEDDGFDAAELEDGDEALVGSDEELPDDFEGFGEEPDEAKDAKTKGKEEKKRKKRKLKHLPTFASAEDYAKLIGDDDEK